MSRLDIDYEDYWSVKEEMKPLIEAHWDYLEKGRTPFLPDPDWEVYDRMAKEGVLGIYTVRDAGTLVGYAVFVAFPSPHYKGKLIANCDVIFLSPEYHGQGAGKKLIQYSEQDLKSRGVDAICISTKTWMPFGNLLESLDFTPIETVYRKVM
jgi:GNAT superfamily N-acetyltransferase